MLYYIVIRSVNGSRMDRTMCDPTLPVRIWIRSSLVFKQLLFLGVIQTQSKELQIFEPSTSLFMNYAFIDIYTNKYLIEM